MFFVNYYSKLRNTLTGGYEEMIAREKGKIVTKEITETNWTLTQRLNIKIKARKLAETITAFKNAHQDLHEMYQEFHIPKRSGGYRIIHAPKEELKLLQQSILKFFTDDCKLLPHNAVHSFVKHRNCKTAIETHQSTGAHWFLKLDIRNFFDSCTFAYAVATCSALHPLSLLPGPTLSNIISICFLDDKLPQGAPTSPILSNIYMQFFDYYLTKELKGFTYTRYADDLLISKTTAFNYQDVIQTTTILLPPGLFIKPEKTRYGSCNGSNWNLGLMYNKDQVITVGYKNKHLIKNKIHNHFTHAPSTDSPEYGEWVSRLCELKGILAYYTFIEPEYFNNLTNKYRALGYAL